jgi:hypothetical protein
MEHPTYSPHLAPTDYHPFRVLKENLCGCKLKDNRKVETLVTRWTLNTGHGPTVIEKRKAHILQYDLNYVGQQMNN